MWYVNIMDSLHKLVSRQWGNLLDDRTPRIPPEKTVFVSHLEKTSIVLDVSEYQHEIKAVGF